MSIADPLPESVDEIGNPNSQARKGQSLRWLLMIAAAAVVGAVIFYVVNFKSPAGSSPGSQKELQQRSLATANVAAPAALSPEAENTRLRSQMSDLQLELQTAREQNAQLATENAGLGTQLTAAPDNTQTYIPAARLDRGYAQTPPAPRETALPSQTAGPASPLFNGAATGEGGAPIAKRSIRVSGPPAAPTPSSPSSDAVQAEKISVYDSSQYVTPNSYVSARVLVGVDMQAGIAATADPKPVLFRIDGAAIGVGADGRYQTSNLKGCLVNGAAFAELSSEKVYIKLQRISCPVEGNRYMVSKVDGYVTYNGKAGVRGRVVTREGNYANKAFIAGTLQGLGQAMSLNNQRTLTGIGSTGLTTAPLGNSEIAQAAAGSGIGNASSMLADYYIKRAEQYQPVIEMPSGTMVELVFLDGFRFTTKGTPQ